MNAATPAVDQWAWLTGVNMTKEEFDILGDVFKEMRRAAEKHGDQSHVPDGTGPTTIPTLTKRYDAAKAAEIYRARCDSSFLSDLGTWADILLEEVFEALAEEDDKKLEAELLQVAAMAFTWVRNIRARRRICWKSHPDEVDGQPVTCKHCRTDG